MRAVTATIAVLAVLSFSDAVRAQVAGRYVEARTCDVYVGPCFAESEVNLAGSQAILVWDITRGRFQGVDLAGLKVVAAVEAQATLGTPFRNPYPAHAVLYVDARATASQKKALVAFARKMAGKLLENVVAVREATIEFRELGEGKVVVRAGSDVEIRTRLATAKDSTCVNEYLYYEPLVQLNPGFKAVVTTRHTFRGKGLKTTWSSPEKRSAFIGTFYVSN